MYKHIYSIYNIKYLRGVGFCFEELQDAHKVVQEYGQIPKCCRVFTWWTGPLEKQHTVIYEQYCCC